MSQQKIDRLQNALDVSGAFDNCFFHSYVVHLLANGLPFPDDFFTFQSILGTDSPASRLRGLVPNEESLSLFDAFSKLTAPNEAPVAPSFIFEKSLVLGVMMREWFASYMFAHPEIGERMLDETVRRFISYTEFRDFMSQQDLLSGAEGVLYTANKDFLEYFFARPQPPQNEQEQHFESYFIQASDDENAALRAYWQTKGYSNYCRQIATPNTKLSFADVSPVLNAIQQPFAVYNAADNSLMQENQQNELNLPILEVKLNAIEGHYHLADHDANAAVLAQYKASYDQYKAEREAVLSSHGNELDSISTKKSLLLGALIPAGILGANITPFGLLIEKIEIMQGFVGPQQQPNSHLNASAAVALQLQPDTHVAEQQLITFDNLLKPLDDKIKNLEKRWENAVLYQRDTKLSHSLKDALTKAKELKAYLTTQKTAYLLNPTNEELNAFKSNCKQRITDAHKILDKHRGWSELLANLVIGIMTLGVGLVVKGIVNAIIQRPFFAVHKTDSAKVLDKVDDEIDRFKP